MDDPDGADSPDTPSEASIDELGSISTRSTFQAVAGDRNDIAALYLFLKLDMLVELARHVSRDFVRRSHLYVNLTDPEIPQLLGRLYARYGCDESLLSTEQRKPIFDAIFEDEAGNFESFRDSLLSASSAYAERVYDSGEEMLLARVRLAHRALRTHLLGFQGTSVQWANQTALSPLANSSYRILRDSGIASVFGVSQPAGAEWPYQEDSNGEKLVQRISHELKWPADGEISQQAFSAHQRVALRGAESLAIVLRFDADATTDQLKTLVSRSYTWKASLLDAQSRGSPGQSRRDPQFARNETLERQLRNAVESATNSEKVPSN